jgi:mRNA (guanine-N7-)-methyltransferase
MWKNQQRHYDAMVAQRSGKRREESPLYDVQKYHNEVKRFLINTFAPRQGTLLDLATGRGGDIAKWTHAGLRYVKAYDLSPAEIAEARRRLQSYDTKGTTIEFETTDRIGLRSFQDPKGPFDVVSCMFAAQYFYKSTETLEALLENVSKNLRDGGYFIGTVPDGKRILKLLDRKDLYESPYLRIVRRFQGEPRGPFGNAIEFSLVGTVTEGGAPEYLAFFTPLKELAARHGLVPVVDYDGPPGMFEPGDRSEAFKHFQGASLNDPDKREISSIFCAFAFQKRPRF